MEETIKNLCYREAGANDIPLLQQLAQAVWPDTYKDILHAGQIEYMMEQLYSENALKEQLSRHHHFIIMYDNGQPSGFADYTISDDPGMYKLNKIYLLREKQGSGRGKALLDEVIRRLKMTGAGLLELNVNRYNKARYFYEKMGFEVFKTVDIPIGNGYFMNDYIMRKRI